MLSNSVFTMKLVVINFIVAVNIHNSLQCPNVSKRPETAKAEYKSGEIADQTLPITMQTIKTKMREAGIFDWDDETLTEMEKKEMGKLFDAVEIMTTSRNRQPSTVQNMFSSLRIVERAVKKQLKEGQISDTLAAKFNWDKLGTRQRRQIEQPMFYQDKETGMRIFNINPQVEQFNH